MNIERARPAQSNIAERLRVVAFAIVFGTGVGIGLYALGDWLIESQHANTRAFYASCVARGGLITEGGINGRMCVGVKTPDL